MEEEQLPENVDDLISEYTDVVNQHGIKSDEASSLYKSIVGQYDSVKPYLDAVNEVEDAFERGIIK